MRLVCMLLATILQLSLLKADLSIVRVKYRGGGDWYNDPSIIPNLAQEINKRTPIRVQEDEVHLSLSDEELFRYPFLFMTGHGNISFSDEEQERLRTHLLNGGFLYVDDDYGMDEAFRREIEETFPGKELLKVPFDHDIYHTVYDLEGVPKIHKHDDKPPQGFGLFEGERMILFYTYESNISDGWADAEVHGDPPEKREAAFQMGVNIFVYAITH
jgi:hypothetical protein